MSRIRFTLAQVKTFPADAATGDVLGLEALVERDSDGFGVAWRFRKRLRRGGGGRGRP